MSENGGEQRAADDAEAEGPARFFWIVHRFSTHVDVLREMLNELVPQMQDEDIKRFSAEALAALSNLPPEKLAALTAKLTAWLEASPGATLGPPHVAEFFDGDQYASGQFFERVLNMVARPARQEIMLNSLLAMAVGGFEVLVAGIVREFYLAHPDALDGSDASFTLQDMERFRDISEARESLIARKVTDLMMGGLDSWVAWFKKHCNADLTRLALDFDQLSEIFQRRHVVMHNGGAASHLYLKHVAGAEKAGVRVGEPLDLDSEYLNGALDHLEVLGTLIGIKAWGTWRTQDRDVAAIILLQRTYRLMVTQRWLAVQALCASGDSFKVRDAIRWPLACNGWHATLKLEGPGAIEADVKRWDTSALAKRFELVQLVLLGNVDAAVSLVPRLLEQREITLMALGEWPILEPLREHADIQVYLTNAAGVDTPELQQPEEGCEDQGMDH